MAILEKRRIGARIHHWTSDRGALRVEQPRPNVLIFRPSGHLEAGFVDLFVQVVDEAIAAGRPHLFWDGDAMEGYESAFRTRIGQKCLAVKRDVGSMNVYTPNRFVAMGASVINVALGGFFKMVKTKAELDAIIARVTVEDPNEAARSER